MRGGEDVRVCISMGGGWGMGTDKGKQPVHVRASPFAS